MIFPKKNNSHRLGLYSPIFPKISQIFGSLASGNCARALPKAAVLQSCRAKLHFQLSISNLAYSEPGSPFPDCREGLTDRLSNSVLLPGIEPWTGRKTDAAITTELMPDPSQWKEKKACSVAWGGFKTHASAASRLFLKPFFSGPTLKTLSLALRFRTAESD